MLSDCPNVMVAEIKLDFQKACLEVVRNCNEALEITPWAAHGTFQLASPWRHIESIPFFDVRCFLQHDMAQQCVAQQCTIVSTL